MRRSKLEIIHICDSFIAINKPPGISVTSDRTGSQELIDLITCELGAEVANRLRLVHRLDKSASGLIILATNRQAQTYLCSLFEERRIEKVYLALVAASVQELCGCIDRPLAHSPHDPSLMCVTDTKGKEALTNWRLLADFGTLALLKVMPVTGRTHQIRVHLASVGMPLAIDPLYGNQGPLLLSDFKLAYRPNKQREETPLISRLTLHAYQMEFNEQASGKPICLVAPLEKKFAATIKMLTKYKPYGLAAFVNHYDYENILSAQRLQ